MRRLLCLMALCLYCTVGYSQVLNGGFESGGISNWSPNGNGSATILPSSMLPMTNPTEGNYFALLTNGANDVGNDGIADTVSLLSDSFSVADPNSTLTFDWKFLTSEFTGSDADTNRLDFIEVSLVPAVGLPIVILHSDASAIGIFSLIGDGSGISAPDGSSFFESTNFTSFSAPISTGQYQLKFTVADVGDGAFDSGLAVDNISITSPMVASEPSTIIFILSILGFIMSRMSVYATKSAHV
jgi:hypothetical protein